MATIQSSIQLMDGMSRPLNSIINAVNLTISALQKVNGTNINLNTSELLGAQAQIQSAGAEIRRIEEDIAKSINTQADNQNKFNNSLKAGISNADNLYSKIKGLIGAYAGFQTIKTGINISDKISQNTARLNLMLDSYKTNDIVNNSNSEIVNNYTDNFDKSSVNNEIVANNFSNYASTVLNKTENIVNNIDNIVSSVANNIDNITDNTASSVINSIDNTTSSIVDNTKNTLINDAVTSNISNLTTNQNTQNFSLNNLKNMIFESSQRSRGDYFATVDSIGKMGLTAGDAFNSPEEVVNFMELINKQFKISGTSQTGIDAAMLQLTQAMGAGVLRGEELNSVF